jgi:hypothetical protein
MAFNQRAKYAQKAMAATAVTAVAAGSTRTGAATNFLPMDRVALGSSVSAKVTMLVNTTSLTLAPQWQGSNDGVTYFNLFAVNSPANVATAAGSGSDVTTTRHVMLPYPPFRFIRMSVLTGGATAHATNDTWAVEYNYVEAPFS